MINFEKMAENTEMLDNEEKGNVYLNKEEFVSIIDRLRESRELVGKVEELFRNSRDNVECDLVLSIIMTALDFCRPQK